MRYSNRIPTDLTSSELSEVWLHDAMIDLTESNPTQVNLEYPEEELAKLFTKSPAFFPYQPDPLGEAATRNIFSVPTFLTASTSEAYAVLFKAFCNPGDKIAMPMPSYPLLPHLAALEGLEVLPYHLRYQDRWQVDLESLHAALQQGARIIVVVQPNNPTGSICSKAEELAITALAERYLVPIIVDEVFQPYSFAEPIAAFVEHTAPLVFILNGLSKAALLPQLKLSWTEVRGDPECVQQALSAIEWVNDAYLSAATPVQRVLPALLTLTEPLQQVVRNRLIQHRQKLQQVFKTSLLEAQGGWYAMLRIRGIADADAEEEFVRLLAAEAHVKVYPGYFFAAEPGHIVLSLLVAPALFEEGLQQSLRVICGQGGLW